MNEDLERGPFTLAAGLLVTDLSNAGQADLASVTV